MNAGFSVEMPRTPRSIGSRLDNSRTIGRHKYRRRHAGLPHGASVVGRSGVSADLGSDFESESTSLLSSEDISDIPAASRIRIILTIHEDDDRQSHSERIDLHQTVHAAATALSSAWLYPSARCIRWDLSSTRHRSWLPMHGVLLFLVCRFRNR